MANELAAVYVSVIPTAKGIAGELSDLFDAPAESAGKSAGRKGGDGFLGGMGGVLKGGIATLFAAAGAAAVKGFTESIEREAASDKIAASFGLSPEEQARSGSIAGKLYADAYGDSFAEVEGTVAQVMESFENLSDEALSDVSANALDFAEIFDTDVAEAVDRAGILMKTGLVDDGEEAFDLLTRGMQELPVSVRDELLEATQEYSTFFADMGLDGQEAFDLIAKAAETGGQFGIDKLGDAFKELSIRATDMSTTSVEAFEVAGLNAEEVAAMFVAGGDTAAEALDMLIDGLDGIKDPVAQSQAAIALFGTPFEDLNQSVPEFIDNLNDAGDGFEGFEGSADEAGETLNDNVSTKIERFKRQALQGLVDFIETRVVPGVEMLQSWFRDNIPEALDRVVEAFGGMDEIREKFEQVKATAQSFVDGVTLLFQRLSDIASRIWARFGDTIVKYASRTLDNLKGMFGSALGAIQGIFETFAGLFSGDWGRMWDGIKQILGSAWDLIRSVIDQGLDFLSTVWQLGLDLLALAWSTLWDKLKQVVGAAWGRIKSAVSGGIDTVLGFLAGLPGAAARALAGLGSALYSRGRELLIGFLDGIKNFWFDIGLWLLNLPSLIVRTLGDLGRLLWNAGRDLLGGLLNGITSRIPDIRGALGDLTDRLTSWKGPPERDRTILYNAGQLIIDGLNRGMTDSFGDTRALLGSFTDEIGGMSPSLNASVTPSMLAMAGAAAGMAPPGGDSTTFNVTVADGRVVRDLDFYSQSMKAGV